MIDITDPTSFVLLTLDSLATTTTSNSCSNNLNSQLNRDMVDSFGTFTLPSHVAFFLGHLPYIPSLESELGRKLWRPSAASHAEALIKLVAPVPQHFSEMGYRVLGFGGVGHFDPSIPSNILPKYFEEFWYRGVPAYRRIGVRRNQDEFTTPLLPAVIDWIKRSSDPFFIFGNFNETHFPYDYPDQPAVSTLYISGLQQFYAATKDKRVREHSEDDDRWEAGRLAAMAQVKALERIDDALGTLFQQLRSRPENVVVIVIGDHGEEFGENGRFGHGHSSAQVCRVPCWTGIL